VLNVFSIESEKMESKHNSAIFPGILPIGCGPTVGPYDLEAPVGPGAPGEIRTTSMTSD